MIENIPNEEACGSGTCDTEDCNSAPHWRRRVRKSGTTGMDGTSSGTQWSRRDAQRRIGGTHGDDIVKVCEDEFKETNRPSKCVSEIMVQSATSSGDMQVQEPHRTNFRTLTTLDCARHPCAVLLINVFSFRRR